MLRGSADFPSSVEDIMSFVDPTIHECKASNRTRVPYPARTEQRGLIWGTKGELELEHKEAKDGHLKDDP